VRSSICHCTGVNAFVRFFVLFSECRSFRVPFLACVHQSCLAVESATFDVASAHDSRFGIIPSHITATASSRATSRQQLIRSIERANYHYSDSRSDSSSCLCLAPRVPSSSYSKLARKLLASLNEGERSESESNSLGFQKIIQDTIDKMRRTHDETMTHKDKIEQR
jgi:hypothetical protein